MKRSLFFSIALLLVMLTTEMSFGGDLVFKVINVNNVVRLNSKKEKSYQDYYINFGTLDGAQIGGTLKAARLVKERSNVPDVPDKTVSILIGTLKIISVEESSCIARVAELIPKEQSPLVEYNAVMIGDVVTPVKEEELKKVESVILSGAILFDFNKYNLKKDATKELDDIAAKIAQGAYKKILIDGYTDSIGSKEYNLQLSKKRASSVLDYLVKKSGLQKELFEANGYGEDKPVDNNNDKEGRAKNRRVEITFFK